MKATVTLEIGPMKVSFAGAVTLSDLDPPNGHSIAGEGSGGISGFAKRHAAVRLEADEGATLLRYTVKADIGGKIAQLGSRLIYGMARKLAGEFFPKLGGIVDGKAAAAEVLGKGWFGKAIGASTTSAVAGLIVLPSCRLTGKCRLGERPSRSVTRPMASSAPRVCNALSAVARDQTQKIAADAPDRADRATGQNSAQGGP